MYNTIACERFHVLRLLLLVAPMLLASCAGQRPPQGGPPDTTPPEIMRSVPPVGATNVHSGTVHLEFSEYVDRRSVEQAVFVSPPVGPLEFSWSGTDVDITIPDTLRSQTTYILSIGTDVADVRNGNKMASAFALSFSTGDHIDSGKISGRVVDPKAAGVFIFAYRLTASRGDTLNPTRTKPDFVTQAGTGGAFALTNLPLGAFRLVAVRDEVRNLLYDVQSDGYGVLPADLHLSPETPSLGGVAFQMTAEDTGKPFLSSARSLSRALTLVKLSEPVDPASVSPDAVVVIDTVTGSKEPLLGLLLNLGARTEMTLVTEPLDSTHGYAVSAPGLRDDYGNRCTPAGVPFTPSGASDTARLTMELAGITDSATDVAPDDTLMVTFNRPVRREAIERGFSLATVRGTKVAGRLVWFGSAAVRFLPDSAMEPGMTYRARIVGDSVQGIGGAALRESVWVRTFKILTDRQLTSLAGTVIDSGAAQAGPVIVTAIQTDARKARKRSVVAGDGAFAFPLLPEGKYALSVFRDADSSGTYGYGLPYPFKTSERFAVSADSLKLRARWPLEGVVVRLK